VAVMNDFCLNLHKLLPQVLKLLFVDIMVIMVLLMKLQQQWELTI
jgi:hypothetical protein